MKNTLTLIALFGIIMISFGQQGVKFEVEKLSKPEELLFTRNYDELYKGSNRN